MNKKLKNSLAVVILIFFSPQCFADDKSADLTIQVSGLLNNSGQVIANIFRSEGDIMKIETAYLRVKADVSNQHAQLVFLNLEYGKYAVSIFHDENGNGDLDHNFIRMPAEPLGFSNGFKMGLFSGLPNFEKLQFDFLPGAETIEISVK